jgi:hypothetical protein
MLSETRLLLKQWRARYKQRSQLIADLQAARGELNLAVEQSFLNRAAAQATRTPNGLQAK